jgi:hypothetical protein
MKYCLLSLYLLSLCIIYSFCKLVVFSDERDDLQLEQSLSTIVKRKLIDDTSSSLDLSNIRNKLRTKRKGRKKKPVASSKKKEGGPYICQNDSVLSYLVSIPRTKSIMFIISHTTESDEIANQYKECYGSDWIEVIHLPKSVYFESIIYSSFFPVSQSIWEKYDYVITATYKTLTRSLLPRYMPLQTFSNIKQMLFIARDLTDPSPPSSDSSSDSLSSSFSSFSSSTLALSGIGYDIYPFFRDFEDMIPTSVKYHSPVFLQVWNLLLRSLGYSQKTIEKFYYIKGFYRNAFMIKPTVLKKLILFMQQAMYLAENNQEIKQLLSSNAYYVLGKKEIALEIFNTSYYQLYPFVFERLPVFFLYANDYHICIGPDTPCKYNYKG